MRTIIALLGIVVLGVSTAFAEAADWPAWRGPNRDGISTENDWQKDWPADGPKLLWKADIGTGFCSVAVADGRAFVLGHRAGSDYVWAFDAETGKGLWSYSYSCALVDNLHEGGPAATPTVDGDRVYTLSKQGHLHCFNVATGKLNGTVDIQQKLGVSMPEWGFSSSPLILGDLLILEAGRTAAIHKMTGKVVWQTDVFSPGYSSPIAFQHQGKTLIASLNSDGLLVLTPEGREVARYPWQTDFLTASTTPIIEGDTIFISTGYGRGCTLLKLAGNQLTPIYENRDMANHMATCILKDGFIFGFDGQSNSRRLCQLKCLDHATGKVLWEQRGLGCGTLILGGDTLLVLTDEGELIAAPVSGDGFKALSRAQVLEGRCWSPPTLANGRIYARNADGLLVCLDVRGKK